MIRSITHRCVDFCFDVIAELFATFLDLGPMSVQMVRRARTRWQARREVPSWETLSQSGTISAEAYVSDHDASYEVADQELVAVPAAASLDEGPPTEEFSPGFLDSVLREEEPALTGR